MCSKHGNYSIFISQHNQENLYDYLMSTDLHFNNQQDIYVSPKNYEESGYGLNLGVLSTSYELHVLENAIGEVS